MIIIDRFEGEFAVLETDSGTENISRSIIPDNASEGDVLRFESGAYFIDSAATEERREMMIEKLNKLRRRRND